MAQLLVEMVSGIRIECTGKDIVYTLTTRSAALALIE